MSGQSGVHIIPSHKEKDKSNIFFFLFLTINKNIAKVHKYGKMRKGVCI